jgi:DNA mismatch endonuclease (patch repair protein)
MTRSENMRRIKSKDTSIELILRKALWKKGIRYRKNCKDVFGKPDICIKKYRLAIFCDSEFWHGKNFLTGKVPKTNQRFWIEKLQKNIERDKQVNLFLKSNRWTILRFWEKDIRKNTEKCINTIINTINKIKITKNN